MVQKIAEIYKSVPVIADKIAHLQVEFTQAIIGGDAAGAEQTLLKAVKMFDTHLGKDKIYAQPSNTAEKAPAFPVDLETSKTHAALMVANIFNTSIGVNNDVASGFLPKVKASAPTIINQMLKQQTASTEEIIHRTHVAWNRMEMNFR